uniref:Uncharacterized protein n=1 Tax=Ditylenchus dipsaci TaxID=166011 RepID=A0A915DHY2_9BILA
MRLLGLALLLFTTGSIKCGNYEDAKDLISSFKSVVDVPLSKDFKKAHLFLSLSKSFLKRTVPFAELFATALTVGLEKVDEKIRNLLGQLEFMSSLRMKVKQSVIDTFVHECNGINSPRVVAEYMALLVRRCAEPVLSTTVLTQLFDLIHNIKFMDYSLTSDEQHLFAERFATVYFHLSSRHEKFSLLAKFADSRKNIFVQNKLVLFGHLIEELGISLLDGLDTFCLPKAAFVLHVQKRDSIERFADNLMQHISSLEYVTVMCANITFYGEPEQADKFTLKVEGILEPVHAFISTWFPAILESTWPTTESLMIRNIMKEESQGVIFAETNQTYKQILNVVHDKMRMVGHP